MATEALIPGITGDRGMSFALGGVAIKTVNRETARCFAFVNSVNYISPCTVVADSAGQILAGNVLGHYIGNVTDATSLKTISRQKGLVMNRFMQSRIRPVTGGTVLRLVARCTAVGNGILDNDRVKCLGFSGMTGGTCPAPTHMLGDDIIGVTLEAAGRINKGIVMGSFVAAAGHGYMTVVTVGGPACRAATKFNGYLNLKVAALVAKVAGQLATWICKEGIF
jgi:hypothetical protein